MIDIRAFAGLGHADHGWLDARHHFSFAGYHDPARMGWGAIRVWNDDTIAAQSGFPPHSHADMEIVTFVRSGAITHQDSLGNTGRTGAGDVQVMSAGTGSPTPNTTWKPNRPRCSRSGSCPTARASNPHGARANFRRRTVLARG